METFDDGACVDFVRRNEAGKIHSSGTLRSVDDDSLVRALSKHSWFSLLDPLMPTRPAMQSTHSPVM